jgi:hypothetical protein
MAPLSLKKGRKIVVRHQKRRKKKQRSWPRENKQVKKKSFVMMMMMKGNRHATHISPHQEKVGTAFSSFQKRVLQFLVAHKKLTFENAKVQ